MAERRDQVTDWHSLDTDEALSRVDSGKDGLSQAEADRRLESHGPNRLPAGKRRSPIARLAAQFNNLLIQILIGAAVVTALLGHWIDTWVILGVVVVNAVIGFVQEGKAEQALEAIRHMLSPRASVTRDRKRRTLPAEELVPGDVVLIEPGDKVPADLRLLRVHNLRVQEAVLTGESVAVEKAVEPVAPDADLGNRVGMAYSGTLVAGGQGVGVVVATGADTEIGRISGMLAEVESITTPLLEQMDRFARLLAMVVVGISAAVFAYGFWLQGREATEMFMTVVGLAVAAIPEGLPAILTVTLAIGVQRMAGRKAIIRRLPAVETLGSVSVICSDKTGTLTRNEMTLRTVVTSGETFTASGAGYDPHGGFSIDGGEVDPEGVPVLRETVQAAARCNDASLRRHGDVWQVDGDPMEGALLVGAMKAGLDLDHEDERLPRTDVIPFETEHRLMATLHHDHEGQGYIFVKGAPERILDLCREQRDAKGGGQPLDRPYWEGRIENIATEGQRMLGIAVRRVPAEHRTLSYDDLDDGMAFLGLLGLMDPPRDEAIVAVHDCRTAGIRVKMITGDHARTAAGIARQLALENVDEVITGHEIDGLDDEELARKAMTVDVFARTTPEHKLRLVTALQAQGQVVAMTGDGVNDAPALKRADVGVAMGHGGTEVAREAAEMVLADDNFASVAQAVREGRTVYDNLKKAILFLLPVNGGESLAILTAVLVGLTLPITPLQILWVNMVSSVGLAMALAFEPPAPNVMRRPPRRRDEPMLSAFLLWRIGFVSTLFVSGVFGIFAWSQFHGSTLEEARTYAVNTLVVMEVFYLFSIRYLDSSSLGFARIKGTPAVLIAVAVVVGLQLLFTYAPFMERLFDTRPVDFIHGMEIIAIGVTLFALLELEKWVRRRLRGRRQSASA
ncbi:MAG: cation-transporting P-type ATPase [Guyparkeria sp.]|uniref:cation-transporting P-type ATPase n=1 Tax=Guyparkeria sp. TaxID=2035736 RepID=UPI00397C939C